MDLTSSSTLGPLVRGRSATRLRWNTLVPSALAVVAVVLLVGSPVFGWFSVVRLSALLLPIVVVSVLAATPWRWRDADWERAARWAPSTQGLSVGAVTAAAVLFWIVYSRFHSGGINAVDFTIYFDRPMFQTSRGHWYLVESTNELPFANLTHLAVHAYWILLPLSGLYWIHATPLWLLALSVIAVVAGGVHTYRIVRQTGGSGALAVAAALAFLLNDNTARTLNYGFHAEVLYAWFIPWAIDAGLRRARTSFLLAVMASVLVKEDAIFPLFALSVALAYARGREMRAVDRVVYLGAPVAVALLNLALFYTVAVPRLSPDGAVMYASFWGSHGPTPWGAAHSLVAHPIALFVGVLTSGLFSIVLVRHLFLPLLGWRWVVGLAPLLVVYGASDNEQIRGFGIYYAIPLVPFLTLASARGAGLLSARFCRPQRAELAAALLVVTSALVVRPGYTVRPWRSELSQVKTILGQLHSESLVLVQSGLYPHAGYATKAQLLTPDTVADPALDGAVLLLAPTISAYPLERDEWECLATNPVAASTTDGLLAVRLTAAAAACTRR